MKPANILVAISCAQLAAAVPELPTLSITNVRQDRPFFEPASMIADARLVNHTGTAFWFTGISGPDNPLYHTRRSLDRWSGSTLCLTGARPFKLAPGEELTFPVHGRGGARVTIRVPMGAAPESIREWMITSPETEFRDTGGSGFLKNPPALAVAFTLLFPLLGGFAYVTRLRASA